MSDDYGSPAAEMRARERQWQLGYEAGLRNRRRLVVIGVVIGLLVIVRRHVGLGAALAWTVCFILAFAPLLVVALVFEIVRRRRRRAQNLNR